MFHAALLVGLCLAAWTVVPFPLAVVVGRSFRAGTGGEIDSVSDGPRR